MIDVICDRASWAELLGRIKERERFSNPDQYNQELMDQCGRPMLISFGNGFDIHIYPPKRD